MKPLRFIWGVGVFTAGAAVSYRMFLRELCLSWGASPSEAAGPLPGDPLLPDADLVATHGIDIAASPTQVWPWLLQAACERGHGMMLDGFRTLLGFPSLESRGSARAAMDARDATGAGADVAPPPNLGLGSVIPRRGQVALRVEAFERERSLVLQTVDGKEVCGISLTAHGLGARLLIRTRRRVRDRFLITRALAPMAREPTLFLLNFELLQWIKTEAERFAHATQVGTTA